MTSAPIILVPGSGSARGRGTRSPPTLRADGHDVTAITLPGLESADADRSKVTFEDHVDAIIDAVEAADAPVVLAVHSAHRVLAATPRATSSRTGSRRWSTSTRRPGSAPLDPDFEGVEKPMVWEEIEAEENLDGLSEEQQATFRERAVPVPGGVLRGRLRVHERRPAGHPVDDHRDRLHGRGLPEVRQGAPRLGVPRRHPGAAQHHLDRPADEPLADVVEAGRPGEDHRRRRDERRREAPR